MTSEDVRIIERFIEIKNKGLYADGKQVTDVYNRVLGKNVPPTNCGSCIRARVSELETALLRFKKMTENKPQEKTKEEAMKERMAKVREAKKNKNQSEG